MSVFVRSAFNYDVDAASDESGLDCQDPSLAKQEFKEESDINTILRRFNVTGHLPNVRLPQFGDFDGIVDFHSAMNAIAQAHESFDALPAEIRSRFQNDPGQFVDFCLDDQNKDELVKMGLAKAPEGLPKPVLVETPVDPAPPPSEPV